jgi:hypothetical protein
MSQPNVSDSNRSAVFPLPQFMPRMRREVNAMDAANARQFEHWQTAGRVTSGPVPVYDVMPNTSRTTDRSYRSQPRFDVQGERGVGNAFFDKYDAVADSRNMARELRGTVYEDKSNGYAAESVSIMERNMESRWMDPVQGREVTWAEAGEALRPRMDDIRQVYR